MCRIWHQTNWFLLFTLETLDVQGVGIYRFRYYRSTLTCFDPFLHHRSKAYNLAALKLNSSMVRLRVCLRRFLCAECERSIMAAHARRRLLNYVPLATSRRSAGAKKLKLASPHQSLHFLCITIKASAEFTIFLDCKVGSYDDLSFFFW